MDNAAAIALIISHMKDADIALFTTGYISRCAFSCGDRENNLYMIGSMGLVSSVGLGISLNTDRRVLVFDGDGSALMDMGTFAMMAAHGLKNLIYIILDNEMYESTGGQPTISAKVDLYKVAEAAGFKKCFKFEEDGEFHRSIGEALSQDGPVLILLKIKRKVSEKECGRVSIPPDQLALRIRKALAR